MNYLCVVKFQMREQDTYITPQNSEVRVRLNLCLKQKLCLKQYTDVEDMKRIISV